MKTATQILSENGIDIMSLNDRFNTSMLRAMEEYAELKAASQFKGSKPPRKLDFIQINDCYFVTIDGERVMGVTVFHRDADYIKNAFDQSQLKGTQLAFSPELIKRKVGDLIMQNIIIEGDSTVDSECAAEAISQWIVNELAKR